MLNVGDKVILKDESEYTKKAGMSKGKTYIISANSYGFVEVEGFIFFHDMKRFELKGKEIVEAEEF